MNKNDVLEIIEEVIFIYSKYNCSIEEAIKRAKEAYLDVTRTIEYTREK